MLTSNAGPHSISFRESANKVALQSGMMVSNEPGYCALSRSCTCLFEKRADVLGNADKDGHWGIRIESVVLCKVLLTSMRCFGGSQRVNG